MKKFTHHLYFWVLVGIASMTLILGVDRFMRESRALANFIGNGVATMVVSRWKKELDGDKLKQELASPTFVERAEVV